MFQHGSRANTSTGTEIAVSLQLPCTSVTALLLQKYETFVKISFVSYRKITSLPHELYDSFYLSFAPEVYP
jgi:hypothetical protein